jgi:hypothetical protein
MLTMALALAAAVMAPSSGGVPVAIANFQTAHLPALTRVERKLPHATMTKQVEDILKSRQCAIAGHQAGAFDLVVPFAILLGEGGVARKIVVNDLGCNPVEMLVARIVAAQAARGDFVMQPGRAEQWFGSDVYFKNSEPTKGEALADPDKVTCKSATKVGSRISVNRVCKTAQEWRAFEQDRQQMGRDIRNAGECAGNRSCSQ